MEKYPKIKRLGDPKTRGVLESGTTVTVQEKMDGANFRFMREEHLDEQYHTDDRSLVFGSRNVVYKNEKDTDSNFTHAIEHTREKVSEKAIQMAEEAMGPLVFFAEAMHPHTLEYDWETIPNVLGFDVWVVDEQRFLGPQETVDTFLHIGLAPAPIIEECPADEIDADYEIPDSTYRDGTAEGVVFKNRDTQTYAKLRAEEFLEKHRGPSPDEGPHDPDGVGQLISTYVTSHRIEKTAYKLVDEGDWDGLQMEMMEDLPKAVLVDVFTEESWDILTENWEIDLGDLRSRVSSKCADVLQEVMQKRVMNDVEGYQETVTYNNGEA